MDEQARRTLSARERRAALEWPVAGAWRSSLLARTVHGVSMFSNRKGIANVLPLFYPVVAGRPYEGETTGMCARATKRGRGVLVGESRKDGLCRAGAELPWRLRCPSQTHRRAQRACAPGATPARREPRRGNRRGPRPSATPGFNVILACPLAHPCGQLHKHSIPAAATYTSREAWPERCVSY